MEIDIRTIVLILGVTHLMQVLVFFHQFKVNKAYKGIGWWLLWSAAETVGFIFILLREIPALSNTAIVVQNVAILAGTIFIYIGVMRFFNKKENLKIIIPFFAVYVSALLYLLFIDDNIQLRSLVTTFAYVFISFLTAYSLYKYKTRSISATANFNIIIFIVHGGIFLYRAIMIINGTSVSDIFTPTLFNFLPYFDALIVSLLWTFGFIIMVNQRLNSEMTESKTHFEQIFSTSPDAAIITRLSDGMIVGFNDGYTRITGYTKEDISGKSSLEINLWKNPEDRKEVVRNIQENGFCENYKALFQLKDGTTITGLMSAKIIMLKGIPHIISITRDITERNKVEEALAENQRLLQDITDNSTSLIYALDTEGRFLLINRSLERVLGVARETMIGRTRDAFMPQEIVNEHRNNDLKVMKNKKPITTEEENLETDGKHTYLSVKFPLINPQGVVIGIGGVSTDFTDRKKAEKERQLFNDVLEQSLNEIYIFDLNTLKFVTVNKGAIENIGYSMEELSQMTPLDLKPQYTLAMFKEIIRPLVENTAKIINFSTNHKRRDGTQYPIEVHLSINQKENVFVAVIVDITERKQKEEELRISSERFKNVFEHAAVGKSITSIDGKLQVNKAFSNITGYSEEELSKLKWYDITHPDDIEKDGEMVDTLVNGDKESARWTKRYIHKNGRVVWVDISSVLQKDADGKPMHFITTISEITEQILTQEKLRATNEYLENLIGYANAPIIVWDANGKITQFNRAFEELSGLKSDMVLGNGLEMLFAEDERERSMGIVNRAQNGERFNLVEVPILQTNGSQRIVLWNSAPIYGPDGQTQIATIAQGQDITERKLAGTILRDEKERIRTILDMVGDPIFVKDNDHRITLANRAFYDMFCLDENKVIGYTLAEAVPENERKQFLEVDRSVLDTGIPDIREEYLTVKDLTRTIITRKTRFINESDNRFLVGSIHDITERKQAEEQLQKSEKEFRNLAESMPQIVWATRPDGWNIYFNQQWVDYTGMTLEESYGHGWNKPFHPEDQQRAWIAWENATKHGATYSIECRLRRADGVYKWWLIRGVPVLDEQGTILKWFGTCTDINEIKLAEEEIQNLNAGLEQRVVERTAQLEASNKELEAFSYSVSHDLRSPLRAIEGFSRFLYDDYYNKLDDEGKRLLNVIKDNTRKMDQLITDLLALSRVARSELNYSRIDMTALAKSMYNEIASDEVKQNFEFNVLKLPDAYGDGNIMRQVWINLISNAIKFSMKSKACKIEIGCTNNKGNNIYYVKDEGIGFDAKYKHKLFGVFQRLHSAEEFEGTGVGLAIAQRIIHRHNGEIWAEGEIGKGATFSFTIGNRN